MKEIGRNIVFGIILTILLTMVQFTLSFSNGGNANSSPFEDIDLLNRIFWSSSIPMGIVSYIFSAINKAQTFLQALISGIIWIAIIIMLYLLIGLDKGNIIQIFNSIGFYFMLFIILVCPIIYYIVKSKKV